MVLALDKDPVAVQSYNINNPEQVAKCLDLATCRLDKVYRLLETRQPIGVIGGPPCQPFSNGNNTRIGEDKKRKSLPKRYASIIARLSQEIDIDFFVFENVRGITFEKHRTSFGRFKTLFEGAGFNLFEGLLDSHNFGVPQSRPRIFVVGLNRAKYPTLDFSFPQPRNPKLTVRDALHGLPEPLLFNPSIRQEDIPHHPNHWAMMPRSEKFKSGFLREGYVRGKSFKVLSWDKPSCTVAYGNREVHIHPSGTRRLSVYEAMLLQGFPRTYRLAGTLSDQIRQVSDAVPPPLAYALALSIRQLLSSQFSGQNYLERVPFA